MTDEFGPHRLPSGTMLQAGIPTRPAQFTLQKSGGLMMRGVVTATYVMDTPGHPAEIANDPTSAPPVAVYCDVLCYTQRSAQRWVFIPKAMVLQDRGAMHNGRVWKPRATTMDISGGTLNVDHGTSLENFDGDHVLIGFVDESLSMPVVLGGVPHPRRDANNDKKDIGHRMKLLVADGDPDFWKHKGAFYGVSDSGDFIIDTTRAFAKDLQSDGTEPDPTKNGVGNVIMWLQKGGTLHIEIDRSTIDSQLGADSGAKPAVCEFDETGLTITLQGGGKNLQTADKDGDATLQLGDGAKHVAIVEQLAALYKSLKQQLDTYDTHVHSTGVGPSGPPNPTCQCPAWDTSIESATMSLPAKHN